MMTDFQNSFTFGISTKHVMNLPLDRFHHASNALLLHYHVKRKCQKTNDNLKQMSRLTLNSKIIYYNHFNYRT